ncbi:MAG: Na+/H+ antiporter subunit E [Micromonosporaceae bacterium]
MTGPVTARLRRAAHRGLQAIAFLGYFSLMFLRANLKVAREIITPGSGLAPAVVWLPLHSRTPLEITSLAHLITLTPGTLVLEARTAPPALLVHGMHAADPDAFLTALTGLENRLLGVLRPAGGDAPCS